MASAVITEHHCYLGEATWYSLHLYKLTHPDLNFVTLIWNYQLLIQMMLEEKAT